MNKHYLNRRVTTILLLVFALIGAWAVNKMLEPEMITNLLVLFSFC
ncbi:hypothetical protein BH11PSE11_BH11PSE11_21310 [soil metagenome]